MRIYINIILIYLDDTLQLSKYIISIKINVAKMCATTFAVVTQLKLTETCHNTSLRTFVKKKEKISTLLMYTYIHLHGLLYFAFWDFFSWKIHKSIIISSSFNPYSSFWKHVCVCMYVFLFFSRTFCNCKDDDDHHHDSMVGRQYYRFLALIEKLCSSRVVCKPFEQLSL